MSRILKHIAKIVLTLVIIAAVGAALVVGVPNGVEIIGQQGNIKQQSDIAATVQSDGAYDCILVLGAAVNSDGSPTTMLKDRLDTAIALYNAGAAPKILMSGDDKSDMSYDEVRVMKQYAVEQGVPSADVFCDHAGICTYDSMYRAKNVFSVSKMVVVTQAYHLPRALFDANALGMQAVGVSASLHDYTDQSYYDQREFFARISDFGKVLTKQQSDYLSEPVSLNQSGDVTTWNKNEQ